MVRGASRGADGLRSSVVHEQRQHGKGPLSTQNIAQHTSPSCGGNPLRKGCRPSPARASVCVCVRARACVVFVLCCVRRVCVFVLCVRCVCVCVACVEASHAHPPPCLRGAEHTHLGDAPHRPPDGVPRGERRDDDAPALPWSGSGAMPDAVRSSNITASISSVVVGGRGIPEIEGKEIPEATLGYAITP